MNRYLTSSSASVLIGSIVQLVDPQPGFVRCDGRTMYNSGQIFCDLWTTTLQLAAAGAVGTPGQCASSGTAVVTAGAGVIKRTTDGINWTTPALPAWPANYSAQAVTWDGTRFICFASSMGAGNDGIYYSISTDNGATWGAYGTVQAPSGNAGSVSGSISATSNTTSGVSLVWTYSTYGRCYRSSNGAAWNGAPAAVGSSSAGFVAFGQNGFLSNTQRSFDGGATWSAISIPATLSALSPMLGTPTGTVIARGDGGGTAADQGTYLRTTDGGASWAFASAPSAGVGAGRLIPAQQGYYRASDGKMFLGLMESIDDGVNWYRRGLPAGAVPQKYLGLGANILSVHTSYGVMFSGAKTGIGIAPFVDSGTSPSEYYLRTA